MLRRLLVVLVVAGCLTTLAMPAAAATRVGEIEEAPASVGFDLVILRPLGLLATGAGVLLALPATAITAITHPRDIHKPIHFFVVRPAKYTFGDPIGSH